ncbi:sigma-70 family RNA polymerase sigma factor [bacterium]|nr:sigma-70 family RNA polymerase sigma factor [bacterium]
MEDSRIIELVLSGDHEAFGLLMDRYYAMVYRLCFNMSGNVPDAEELAHDSFVEAYLNLSQLREPEKFAGWLKTIALNICRMWYRKNQQRDLELVEEHIASVDEGDEDSSIYARMSYGLSTLSTSHRLVIALYYHEGLSYDEIATFLEVPKGTVMSRLHRARQALKEVMEQMTEYEEIPDVPDDKFKEVVQAEIAVLMKMFPDEPNVPERLTLVLKKSPGRLADLVAGANADEMLRNIAILLPHLGSEAIDTVLSCRFSDDEYKVSKTSQLLRIYASRCGMVSPREGMPDIASKEAYLLLDRLFAHPADDSAKAEVLLEMMEASEHSCPALLFANALMCYEQAFPVLMERFISQSSDQPSRVINALVRTGMRFAENMLSLIEEADQNRQAMGLIGCEAIARSLCPTCFVDTSREQFLNDLRTQEKWPTLMVEEIGADLIERIIRAIAAIAESGSIGLRSQAVRILGCLKADKYTSLIREMLHDADHAVRLAAIFALSEIGDAAAAEELIDCAQNGDTQEQAAAITALGRLKIVHAEHILVDMISSDDNQVCEAAVTALGEMGSVSSQIVLQELMRGTNHKLQKVAAKAVFGGVAHRKPVLSDVEQRLAAKRRKVSPIAMISPDAVLRFGVTQMRSYDERELTECIARVCSDYCATRRYMIELGLMTRSNGVYEFTPSGESTWRVEQFICQRYLAKAGRCMLFTQ